MLACGMMMLGDCAMRAERAIMMSAAVSDDGQEHKGVPRQHGVMARVLREMTVWYVRRARTCVRRT